MSLMQTFGRLQLRQRLVAAGAAFDKVEGVVPVREILVDPPGDPLLQGMDLDSRLSPLLAVSTLACG
jgi:hypothetical protein